MQEDADGDWGEGDDSHRFIQEEPPKVLALSTLTRFRTFVHALGDEPIRTGRAEQDFYLRKRRRYEDGGLDASGQPYVQPLLRLLCDGYDIAARQVDTLAWLTARPRHSRDVLARFSLDRKLGAPPSLACVNRALAALGGGEDVDAVLDLIEDTIAAASPIALSTLLAATRALRCHPVRAARVALSLQGALPSGSAPVPRVLWHELGTALARHSQRLPKPLDDDFMDLLDATMAPARGDGDPLPERVLVAHGSCLLASRRPLAASVALVAQELLQSGRSKRGGEDTTNSGRSGESISDDAIDASDLSLSAFLTDLLVALGHCSLATIAARGATTVTTDEESKVLAARTQVGVANHAELLTFCTDVVRYAHTRRIRLAPKAFDAILRVCDDTRDLQRLCTLFTAMCVLSAPTLVSSLRVAEVLTQTPALWPHVTAVAGCSPVALLVWCLRRFPAVVALQPHHTACEEEALYALCETIGTLLASATESHERHTVTASTSPAAHITTTSAVRLHEALDILLRECPSPGFAGAALCAFVAKQRTQQLLLKDSTDVDSAEASTLSVSATATEEPSWKQLQALEALNAVALESLLHESAASMVESDAGVRRHRLFEDSGRHDSTHLGAALRAVLTSPQVYCNVLDVSALNILAAHAAAETAFARMMANYVSKTGAVAVVPLELLSASAGVTDATRVLVRTWRRMHPDWFALLPLSLSLQLAGTTETEIAADFFLHVRRAGHQKVALVTGTAASAEAARQMGVQPAIHLPDLLAKLGAPVTQQ